MFLFGTLFNVTFNEWKRCKDEEEIFIRVFFPQQLDHMAMLFYA
jgi:hypothetical protein